MRHDPVVLEGLEDFLRTLAEEENASIHTVRAYRTDLTHFSRFLDAWMAGRETDYRGTCPVSRRARKGGVQTAEEVHSVSPNDITTGAVRGWVARMHAAALSAVTMGRKLAAVRSFCAWLP